MPNCFNLTRKSDLKDNPKAGPENLHVVDEEMCKHFNIPVQKKFWCRGWYGGIGFGLATGRSFEKQIEENERSLKEEVLKPALDLEEIRYLREQREVLLWLNENFVSDAWVEIGKRR